MRLSNSKFFQRIKQDKLTKTLRILSLANTLSFSTVAMEKLIMNYDKNQASVINSLSAIPLLYDLGFALGHEVFYGNRNFIEIVGNQLGTKNIWPRPYLTTPE